jgi:hypothetical protein
MKRKRYAKLRLAALSILGAETVAFFALLLANSHAYPFASGNSHPRTDLKSNDAKRSNSGGMGYGNWIATRGDYTATCVIGSGSCTEPEGTTDLGYVQDYNFANSAADSIPSSYDGDRYQPGNENNALTGGLATGNWPSDGVFGVTSNSPFGRFLADQIDFLGSAGGNTGPGPEIFIPPIDPPDILDVDPSDPGPFNITPDIANGLPIAPDAEVRSVPEPMSLSLFGAGFIGMALLYRRKKKLA